MAIALPQTVAPSYLLQSRQWRPQGWSIVGAPRIVRQVPSDAYGRPAVELAVDAFEWTDVNAFGVGNTDDGMTRLRAEIQKRGSDLYAYCLFKREIVNLFGVHSWSYRLVLLHSFVQLVGWALVILAAAFAAVIFIQYLTTGQAPAVADLLGLWQGVIKSAGDAGGQITGGFSAPFIWVTAAAGVGSLFFYLASQKVGAKAAPPRLPAAHGSVGVKAGPVSTRLSN